MTECALRNDTMTKRQSAFLSAVHVDEQNLAVRRMVKTNMERASADEIDASPAQVI
jgi:hypothetical protein